MNDLQLLLDEYLATRRALGAKLEQSGSLLKSFVAFSTQHQATFITTQCALQWATEPRNVPSSRSAVRLGTVRRFAIYANAVDGRHEVPPQGLLPRRTHRRPPYIYSDGEIVALIDAAHRLSGTTGLRPSTFATLLGLLTVTGMRSGEVVNLDRDDIDLAQGVVTIHGSKFGKSRQIHLHPSAIEALNRHAAQRDRLCPNPQGPSFFLDERGIGITDWKLRWTFAKLAQRTGLRDRSRSHGNGPRLHDIRHTFACNTLLRWYCSGVDVERHLPHLATWLGHVKISDTYWYLTATPELMQAAADRLDRTTRRLP